MKKKMSKLVAEYIEVEKALIEELIILKNWGSGCGCDDVEIIKLIHEGECDEIMTYCLNCGGWVV